MLRQNRYKPEDFIQAITDEERICEDEILVSKKHDIVIALETEQVEKLEELKGFMMKIINQIPEFDNETQDYYETISNDKDFPHRLAAIYFEGNEVRLDYWSEDVNNQFDIVFNFEKDKWILTR